MSLRATIAATLASALLLWASAPPVAAGWLAWVALVPVALVALRASGGRARRLSVPLAYAVYLELLLVPALPFGLAENQWGEPVLPIMIGGSPVVFVAALAVPLFGLALYAARFPQPVPLERAPGAWAGAAFVLVPAATWTALDLLRSKFDPGGFWGPLYLSQHDTAAGALATAGGPWLVTFAIVACNYGLALALVRAPRRRPAVACAAVALLAPLHALAAEPDASTKVSVAAVQPGYDTAEFGRPVLHYLRRAHRDLELASLDLVADLAPLTLEAGRRGAQLAVWPEATVWVDPRRNAAVRAALTSLAHEADLALVVPYFLRSHSHGAAVVVLPDGAITEPQPKQRPMWFLGENGDNRVPPRPARTSVGRLGTLLGVDPQDPAWPRELAARGAELLVSSTHDWPALARQQRALAQTHSSALGLPLVRADWRYGSAVFAGGRKVADAGLAKRRGVVVADVETGGAPSAYARLGDAFGWACLVAVAPLYLARVVLRLRGQRADAERPAHALGESELGAHPPP